MEYIDRKSEIKRKRNLQRDQEHWEEVHNNLIEVQQMNRAQKKSLQISDPGHADEKEADLVATKVVSGESAEIHRAGSAINRKGERTSETTAEFQSKLESSKGGGQSLDDSTRSEMESKMGADFSGVKIHTGGEAHNMSESINAKAFTHGQDVYFKQGEFNANSQGGKELLAHELVHTVQQSNGKVQPKIQRFDGPDPYANYSNSFEVVFDGDTLIFTITRMTKSVDDMKTLESVEKPSGYSLIITAKNGGDKSITDCVFFYGLNAPPIPLFITEGAIVFKTEDDFINLMITDRVELSEENGTTIKTHYFTTSQQSGVFPQNAEVLSVRVPTKKSATDTNAVPYIPDIPGRSHDATGDIFTGLYTRFDGNGDQKKDMLMKQLYQQTVHVRKKRTDPLQEPEESFLFSLTSYDTHETFEKEIKPAFLKTRMMGGNYTLEHIQRSDGTLPNVWKLKGIYDKEYKPITDTYYLFIYAPVHEGNQLRYEVNYAGVTFQALFNYDKTEFNKTITAGAPVYGMDKMAVDLRMGTFQDKLRLVLEPIPGESNKSRLFMFMYIDESEIAAPQTATKDTETATPVAPLEIGIGPPYSLAVTNSEDKTDNVAMRLDFNGDGKEEIVIYDRLIEDNDFFDEKHANNARQHWVHVKGENVNPPDSVVMFRIQLREMKRSPHEAPDDATFTQYMKFFLPGDFDRTTKPGATDMFSELVALIAQITQFRRSLENEFRSDVPFTDKMDVAWNNYVISAYTLYPLKNADTPQADATAESTYKTNVEAFYDAFKAEVKEGEKDERWWQSSFSLDKPDKKLQKKLDTANWKKVNKELSYYAKRYAAWTNEVMEKVASKATERDHKNDDYLFISNYETKQANTAKGLKQRLKAVTKIQNKPGLQHLRVMHYPKDWTYNNDRGENVRLTRVPLEVYYWKEDDEWHVKDITNPDDTYERTMDVQDGETEPPLALFDLLNESGHFVEGYMVVELPSGAMYEVPTYMAHDATYYATYIALALALVASMLTGIGEVGGALWLTGEIMMATADVLFVVSSIARLEDLAAHDKLTFTNVLLEVGNIISCSAGALMKGPGIILGTASKTESLIFGKMVPLIEASKVGYITLFNAQKVGNAAIVLALSIDSIQQLAALEGKGSREDMIRAGQALLMQLLAAGMFKSLRITNEEALLAAQGGKNLMLLEIEGQLCIAPARPALQNLLTGTVQGGKLTAKAMNGLLGMTDGEIAALTGKTVAEVERAGLFSFLKKNDPQFNSTLADVQSSTNVLDHVFEGHPTTSGSVKGVHHHDALTTKTTGFTTGDIRIQPGTERVVDATTGVYEGLVERFDGTRWVPKTGGQPSGYSTFFPKNWTRQQTIDEIAFAKNNGLTWQPPIFPKTTSNTYFGFSSDGVRIDFYIGSPVTAAPAVTPTNIISTFPGK